jgi:sarcosine oxidase/L-pipecolate oxidase
VPETQSLLGVTLHPIAFVRPPPSLVSSSLAAGRFVAYLADTSSSGFYGFPPHPLNGWLKIGHHAEGLALAPSELPLGDDVVPFLSALGAKYRVSIERFFRRFLAGSLPALADAEITATRLCLYCDSRDGDFLSACVCVCLCVRVFVCGQAHLACAQSIEFQTLVRVVRTMARACSHTPALLLLLENLVVASGDSGHGFKFAPFIGEIIADVSKRVPNRYSYRFAWRGVGDAGSFEEVRAPRNGPASSAHWINDGGGGGAKL